jgi:hypothetical protein
MSSELRVDTIKLANGNTATASGLGIGGVGKVLQHISATTTNGLSTSSSSFAEIGTGFRVTITPTSASNRILIRYTMGWEDNNAGGRDLAYAIYKDGSTNLGTAASLFSDMSYNYDAGRLQNSGRVIAFIDATTNSTAERYYTLFGRTTTGSAVQFNTNNASGRQALCEVMEIA